MGICPNCGEWVDEGDICMCCGGGTGRYYDDDCEDYSSSYGSSFSDESIDKRQKRNLEYDKRRYEDSLELARNESDVGYRLKHYSEAIDNAERYHALSERYGIRIEGMCDEEHPLQYEDIQWLSKKHYENLNRFTLFGNDELDKIDEILKRAGNVNVIRQNESRLRAENEERAKQRSIERAKSLRKSYFEHVEKANSAVDEDKPKKAIKEYRKADRDWIEYFNHDYKKDPHKNRMPEDKFTEDTVRHMMELYVRTHPLLTSKKKLLKINREIKDMLDGRWEDSIVEADRKAQEIYDEKHRKRMEMAEKVGEVIADARIAGEKLFERIRK